MGNLKSINILNQLTLYLSGENTGRNFFVPAMEKVVDIVND